jgi:hypothetical protein
MHHMSGLECAHLPLIEFARTACGWDRDRRLRKP